MAEKIQILDVPLGLAQCQQVLQELGSEMGYKVKGVQGNAIFWKVGGWLSLRNYNLQVRMSPLGENETRVEIVASAPGLMDGWGILEQGAKEFADELKSELGMSVSETSGAETRKRSGCLSAFLVLAMIANPLIALLTWIGAADMPSSVQPLMVFGGLLNLACLGFAIGIWKWKRWGVYGYVISLGLFVVLNFMVGDVAGAVRGLAPIGLLVLLISPVWKQLD